MGEINLSDGTEIENEWKRGRRQFGHGAQRQKKDLAVLKSTQLLAIIYLLKKRFSPDHGPVSKHHLEQSGSH